MIDNTGWAMEAFSWVNRQQKLEQRRFKRDREKQREAEENERERSRKKGTYRFDGEYAIVWLCHPFYVICAATVGLELRGNKANRILPTRKR